MDFILLTAASQVTHLLLSSAENAQSKKAFDDHFSFKVHQKSSFSSIQLPSKSSSRFY